jgi:3-hydroxyisobutyrate dehydrogenase-like beta-hydroxyacid dehydrogenase
VDLALSTAGEAGVALPTAQLIRQNLLEAISGGHGDKDWAGLAEYVRKSG